MGTLGNTGKQLSNYITFVGHVVLRGEGVAGGEHAADRLRNRVNVSLSGQLYTLQARKVFLLQNFSEFRQTPVEKIYRLIV